ncbi:MAG TPA: sulfotransferase [Anaerolineae bacterium]|nr:sulfotransferase [Anaerolineae bacterium]
MMIIAIGNAPSSGSTLLADLLDSLPFAVCGPEIRLFSVRAYFTRYAEVRWREPFVRSATASCYSVRLGLARSRLHTYGLNARMVQDFMSQAEEFPAFCARFFEHFVALRGKEGRLCCEKTPQNIQNARLFLEAFPDSVFLHIVRNPLYVYKSLRRRGFPPYVAAATWLVDEAPAYELREHPRFITVKYEELVRSPYETVAALVRSWGEEIQPERLAELYRNNRYRTLYVPKLPSWKVSQHGTVQNANRGEVTEEDKAALSYMLSSKIGPEYARTFGLPEVSFAEVSAFYGYDFGTERPANPTSLGWPDWESWRRLSRKWRLDFTHGEAALRSLPAYLHPVVQERE